jgi:hypothetical protein
MANEKRASKIMTEPLPQILEEIEDSIRAANEAAKDARKAAEEARKAGEKAANEAARVASEAIGRVEQIAKNALQLAELVQLAVMEGTTAAQKRLTAEKESASQSKKSARGWKRNGSETIPGRRAKWLTKMLGPPKRGKRGMQKNRK